jgi:hypothetical protein
MNFYLSIAFTLLAAVSGMYLLAKTKAESLGKFFKFISWAVIIIAGLSLVCQIGRAACRMLCCHERCVFSDNCMPGMTMEKVHMNGMNGCNEMTSCRTGGEECCGKHGCNMEGVHGKCCDEMEEQGKECNHDRKNGHMEETADSAKTK